MSRQEIRGEADQRGGYADIGHVFVAGFPPREKPEGKQPQQRAVRVRGDQVNRVDNAPVVHGLERQDDPDEQDRDRHVYRQADTPRPSRLRPLHAEDVHAKRGGERRQRRVGAAESRRYDTDREEDQDALAQDPRGAKHREDVVAQGRQRDLLPRRQRQQQYPQREKQEVDRREGEAIHVHVLLRVLQALAGEVLLHHVLIQPGHDDRDEDTAEELLEEVLRAVPIAELEDPEMGALHQRPRHPPEIQSQLLLHLPDDHHQRRHEAESLQRIGPDDRLDAAPERVQPYQQDAQERGRGERDLPGVEHVGLQDQDHQVQARGRPHALREQEERGPGLVPPSPDPLLQIRVDGGKPQLVVQRQQHLGDDDISDEEAPYRLHIRHVDRTRHAGYRYERHPRQGGAHHADRDDVPRRFPLPEEEGLVAVITPRDPRDQQQDGEIGGDDKKDNRAVHIRLTSFC